MRCRSQAIQRVIGVIVDICTVGHLRDVANGVIDIEVGERVVILECVDGVGAI
jgi:hypothetical protein